MNLAQDYHGYIDLHKFIGQLISKIKEYFQITFKDNFKPEEFELLMAVQTQDQGAILKHIHGEGFAVDIKRHRYVVGGTETGMMRTRTMLEPIWRRGMNMAQTGEFGYYFIRYIEKYHLDDLIGTEEDAKPQIWYIPDKGHLAEAKEPYLTELENKTHDRLSANETNLLGLFGLLPS